MGLANLGFRHGDVGGPSTVSIDSYCVVYAAGAAKVIIPTVAVVARVATAVGIDHHFLADFQASHCWPDRVDRPRKFMAKDEIALGLAWERSLVTIILYY